MSNNINSVHATVSIYLHEFVMRCIMRSDVYALGVIAYEILTGDSPYNLKNKMIHEAARIIREDEPM